MKYKVGDKVKIKTWAKLEKEYGLTPTENIHCKKHSFMPSMEKNLNQLNCDRILTIKKTVPTGYHMKELNCTWSEAMIDCLIKPEPIFTRFEILDL